jgi:hypothetical protein
VAGWDQTLEPSEMLQVATAVIALDPTTIVGVQIDDVVKHLIGNKGLLRHSGRLIAVGFGWE